MHIDLGKKVSI